MSRTFEQVKHSAMPATTEIPINGIQLYTGKIQRFMENPGSRQLLSRDIATTFLEHPETIIDYTEAFQTAKTAGGSKYKAKDFETLDRFIVDEIKLYPRTHFQEVVEHPQRLIPIIRTTLNVENPNSDVSINDFPKLDPKRKAHYICMQFFTSLFRQAEYFPHQKNDEQMSSKNMALVQKKIVDLFYALAQSVVYDTDTSIKTDSQTFFVGALNNFMPSMMDSGDHTAGLLHTAAFSMDDDVVAKVAFINVLAQTIDSSRNMNKFAGIQKAVQEENAVAKQYLAETQHQDPQRLNKLRQIDTHFRVNIVQNPKEAPDDQFYLSEDIDEVERHIFDYNPNVWYAFARLYSKYSKSGCIPITFPSGIWKGIGNGDGKNTERTFRLLQTTWRSTSGEQFVGFNRAIQDAMTHLLPITENGQTEMSRIDVSVVLNQNIGEVLQMGSIPLDMTIGHKLVHVQFASNGRLYFQNGEPLVIPKDQEEQWVPFITRTIRPLLLTYIKQGIGVLPSEAIPLITRFITPELLEKTFEDIEADLKTVKEYLTHPRRGILEQGITVKIRRGQLPDETPIESIKYNQAASEAEVRLGGTILKIGINMTQSPPSITTVNDIDIPEGNEKVWLEYIVLSPLKAITCPNTDMGKDEVDESVLLTDLEDQPINVAAKKTIEILHKSIGHLYRLGRKSNGEPKKPTPEQIERVKLVTFPLPGTEQLDLVQKNKVKPDSKDPDDRTKDSDLYWDYAIYKAENYEKHQRIKHAEVVAPHAYDVLSKLLAVKKDKEI